MFDKIMFGLLVFGLFLVLLFLLAIKGVGGLVLTIIMLWLTASFVKEGIKEFW